MTCIEFPTGTRLDSLKVVELESSCAASCLLLPKRDGFSVETFLFSDGRSERPRGPDPSLSSEVEVDNDDVSNSPPGAFCYTADSIGSITGIPREKNVKLILLFLTDPYFGSQTNFTRCLIEHYGNVVIAGGCTDNLIPDRTSQSEYVVTLTNLLIFAFHYCPEYFNNLLCLWTTHIA